jgi:hypothetical protein
MRGLKESRSVTSPTRSTCCLLALLKLRVKALGRQALVLIVIKLGARRYYRESGSNVK